MSYPEFLIDKRVLRRNVARGIVDAKKYEKELSKLPDVEANAEPSTAEPPAPAEDAAADSAADGSTAAAEE